MTIMRSRIASAIAASFVIAQTAGTAIAADPPLKVATPLAVKGTQSVVIGAFNVGFIFQSIDNTQATGGMIGAFGSTTRAKSELQGVTPAMMQAITDAAYADFKLQLESKGFTVSDPAGLFASEAFTKVKSAASPYEASLQLDKKSKGKANYYKPTALPSLIMIPGDVTSSGFGGMGMAMAAGNTQYAMSQHAKTSGQAVIDVVYLIDFSDTKRPGAFSLGGLKVTSGMSVVDDYSRLSIVAPSGKTASITLKQPVAVEGDFAEMQDATKDATVQSAANVLGGLAAAGGLGGLRFGKSRTYAFTAKPGVYEQGAIKATTLTNSRVVEQLAALR